MASFDYNLLQREAERSLALSQYPHRRLVMIHSGVTVGLGLAVSLLGYLLDLGIAQTGGLGGIGTRTILETIQSILQIAHTMLLPFWAIGYTFAVLCWIRGDHPYPGEFLQGFRRFGPVLRLQILRGALLFGLGFLGAYIGSTVFLLTPGAETFYEIMQQMSPQQLQDPETLMQSQTYMELTVMMTPYILVAAALMVIPFAYRLRFADYVLMDTPRGGSLYALLKSWHMTRKKCGMLLKLDLHFWWYHLAGLLIAVVAYGDVLLPMAGVNLGIDAVGAMFAFYIVALFLEFGLHTWKKNQIFVVYGLAYRELEAPAVVEEKPQEQPKRVPWD
jgi:hypothetical protein